MTDRQGLHMDPGLAVSCHAATQDTLAAQQSAFSVEEQTIWADATSFLTSACDELGVGGLIHGENFSLFEAMSALEIMDPKMDSGLKTTGYSSVEEAIEKGAAPTVLTIPEVIDIMDHLLACEATWHKGHSLAQTVFSCLYMLKLDRAAPNAVLHAYCKVTRATCSLVRTVVALSDVHEEEDFVSFGFGLPLEGEGDSKCLVMINAVEEQLARQLRGCKALAMEKGNFWKVKPLQDDPALEEGFCDALLCRLRFRKALYHSLAYMDKPLSRGAEIAQKHIVRALGELSAMKTSSDFLSSQRQLKEPVHAPSTASGQAAVGFDESVNGRLLTPTPPRSIDILSWIEMLSYFEQFLNDLHRICSLSSDLDLEELFQYILDFQKCHPDLVARAFLQVMLLQDGKLRGRDLVTNAVYRAIKLPSQASSQAIEIAIVLLRQEEIMCANPAWQRRKLGRVILEWGNILELAETAHESSVERSLTGGQQGKGQTSWADSVVMGWAAGQLCWIVTHFLLLGFELELYSLNEFCMVYWYLDHALLTLLQYKLPTERRKIELELLKSSDASSDSAKKKGRKKKRGPLKSAAAKEIRSSPGMLLLQCYSDLCKGFCWMLAAFIADQKITHRETIFNTELERFMQRFELLHKIVVPEPLTFLDYQEDMYHKQCSIKELYGVAYDHFMAAEQHVQELSEAVAKTLKMEPVSRAQRALDVQQMEQVVCRNRTALNCTPGRTWRQP